MTVLSQGEVNQPILILNEPNVLPENPPLTEDQASLLQQFKARLPEIINPDKTDHDDEVFCDNPCLLRYLRTTNWKLENAAKRLKSTLDWRRSYKPHMLQASDMMDVGAKGQVYVNGFDRQNRPIVYMVPRNENSKDERKKVQLMVYALETAIKCMPPGVEQLSVLVDWRGHSAMTSFSLASAKESITIMSHHYPERLARICSIDAAWILSAFFKIILPFFDPVTREKISIISLKDKDNSKVEDKLTKYIDTKYLPEDMGGYNEYQFTDKSYFNRLSNLYETTL